MISRRLEKESQKKEHKIGLALSGGGYRAAAFHLGTLRKLYELQLLDKLDVISTISGGSIAGVYYALNKDNFNEFSDGFKKALKKSVLRRIFFSFRFILTVSTLVLFIVLGSWTLCWLNVASGWIVGFIITTIITIFIFQFRFVNLTKMKIAAYRKIFFGDKTLKDLPNYPKMAINATNLETGTLWTYSKGKVSDSSYAFPKDSGKSIEFKCNDFPIAIAVASSTAVPVPFNPIKIQKKFFVNPKDYGRIAPSLIDGGLYDNQGIHKITQRNSSYHCDIIICSDGSQPYKYKFKGKNSIGVLYRATDVMMRKIKNLQFIRDVYDTKREIAYFSLDWQYDRSVKEFVTAAISGTIDGGLLTLHGININDYKKEGGYDQGKISEAIKQKINYEKIIVSGLLPEQIVTIGNIKTNLTALSDEQIELLSNHASVLTELHINLYCPDLLRTQY